jgi:hypothetical protein
MPGPEKKKRIRKVKVDPLELNKETVQGLTEAEAEEVKGGVKNTDVRSGNRCCTAGCPLQPPPKPSGAPTCKDCQTFLCV